MGHLLASFSSLVMEGFWMRAVWGEPHVWLLDDTTWTLGGRVFRWFAKLFAPYSESFSAQYRTRLCAVYRDEFGIAGDGNPEPHEVFWTANGYLMENAGSIYQHLLHFVELYGFSRNGSMGFAAIALVAYFRTWTVVLDHPSDAGIALVWTFDCIAVPALVCSLLLFINYIKLFRRHQQAVLRCFLAVAGVDDEDGDEEGEPAGAAPTGRPDNLALSLSLQLPGGDNRTTSAS